MQAFESSKRFVLVAVFIALVTFGGETRLAFCRETAGIAKAVDLIKSINDLTLHDGTRDKDLHVRVTFPETIEKLPIIIFSHGAGGSKDSYRFLTNYWANSGYVVVQPTHADSIGKPDSVSAGLKTIMAEIGKIPTDYSGWNNRFRDISFTIDSIAQIEKATGVKIDKSRIGVGGHSYGAFTTVIIGGGKVPSRGLDAVHTARDDRVKAILAISSQSVRNRQRDFGFDDQTTWQNIKVPAMYMTGTNDRTGWTKASDRKQAFTDSPPGDKYFVMIEGANHMTFAGRDPSARPGSMLRAEAQSDKKDQQSKDGTSANENSSPQTKQRKSTRLSGGISDGLSRQFGPSEKGDHQLMLKDIQTVSTIFWDAYLKGDTNAKEKLQSKSLQAPGNLLEMEVK